jgi:hypothetical protein
MHSHECGRKSRRRTSWHSLLCTCNIAAMTLSLDDLTAVPTASLRDGRPGGSPGYDLQRSAPTLAVPLSKSSRPCNVHYILLPNANAAQQPIKHSPPSGVTGPSILNLCGSSTSKYMLPLNIVMPATKSEAAILFLELRMSQGG